MKEAEKAIAAGVDCIVVQGVEAGGHVRGTVCTAILFICYSAHQTASWSIVMHHALEQIICHVQFSQLEYIYQVFNHEIIVT